MARSGHRAARLNDKTRLILLVQPAYRTAGRALPYLYRVGLQTITYNVPSDVYLTAWTEDLDEANQDFDDLLARLAANEEID